MRAFSSIFIATYSRIICLLVLESTDESPFWLYQMCPSRDFCQTHTVRALFLLHAGPQFKFGQQLVCRFPCPLFKLSFKCGISWVLCRCDHRSRLNDNHVGFSQRHSVDVWLVIVLTRVHWLGPNLIHSAGQLGLFATQNRQHLSFVEAVSSKNAAQFRGVKYSWVLLQAVDCALDR